MPTNTNFQHGLQTSDILASGTITCDTIIADTEIIDSVVENSVQIGASGTAGLLTIFPTTALKGHVAITAGDAAGNTTTTITTASQAAARTYTIPDAGASTAEFVLTAGAQALANKTLTAPVLSGSVTGTYTLAGTPTLTSPTINGAILSIAASRSGTVILNGATPVAVSNANVTANSVIVLTLKTVGGTVSPNAPNVLTITPTTGFTVAGTASDTSTYNYTIIS